MARVDKSEHSPNLRKVKSKKNVAVTTFLKLNQRGNMFVAKLRMIDNGFYSKQAEKGLVTEYCNCLGLDETFVHDDGVPVFVEFANCKENDPPNICMECMAYRHFLTPNQEEYEDFYKVLKEMNE